MVALTRRDKEASAHVTPDLFLRNLSQMASLSCLKG
jgi:hypothetical protein